MSTINTLIFDFGDVFINLDKKGAITNVLKTFGITELKEDVIAINNLYEQGLVTTSEFLQFYKDNFPKHSKQQIIETWNYILKDFPIYRLEFIKQLYKDSNYKLILLSNTNDLHIRWIAKNISIYEEFKQCFDAFYLSHEIQLRKPNVAIYKYVLREHNLKPEECLFIDDTKENTEAASVLGIHTWNIDETKQDVVDLFTINSELF